MATGIVPYEKKQRVFTVMCDKCGCMYIPERDNDMLFSDGTIACFEPCPECGYDLNGKSSIIPQWQYKLIRFYRSIRKTNTALPRTNDTVRCLVNVNDFDPSFRYHFWSGVERTAENVLHCKVEPYIIVRSDRRAIKRNEVIKRSSDDKG